MFELNSSIHFKGTFTPRYSGILPPYPRGHFESGDMLIIDHTGLDAEMEEKFKNVHYVVYVKDEGWVKINGLSR